MKKRWRFFFTGTGQDGTPVMSQIVTVNLPAELPISEGLLREMEDFGNANRESFAPAFIHHFEAV